MAYIFVVKTKRGSKAMFSVVLLVIKTETPICISAFWVSLSSSYILQCASTLEFLPSIKPINVYTHPFPSSPLPFFLLPTPIHILCGGNFKTIEMFSSQGPKMQASVLVKYPIWILLCFSLYLGFSPVVISVFARKCPLVSISEVSNAKSYHK